VSTVGVLLASLFATAAAFAPVGTWQRRTFVASSSSPAVLASSSSRSSTSLYANVASSLLWDEVHSKIGQETGSGSGGKRRLSRPERKALERKRKNNRKTNMNHRKHNFADRASLLNGRRAPGEGRYDLHSTAISSLNKNTTTAEDVLKAIKRAQNLHDVHDIRAIERFLLEEVDHGFAYGYRGSLLARLAVAALHMNNHKLARRAIEERRLQHRPSMLPMESAAIIRGLLRVHNVTDALYLLDDELALPTEGANFGDEAIQEIIKHRALALGSVASRHFFEDEPILAVQACQRVAEMGPLVRQAKLTSAQLDMPWARIVQGAAQCESKRRDGTIVIENNDKVKLPCNLVYAVLNAMTTFPSDNDDLTFERLSNALVRRVVFVTGAVTLDGCPPPDRGEAAFIGRSNVGKSSLINMISNRKSLAYTSKTPGKTQQFNYFAVNDKPGREREIKYGDVLDSEKDLDSLYLVDLPGFGFAKVPAYQRQEWSRFMVQYMETRPSLRVLFHLIDARHGPTEEDERIIEQVGLSLPHRGSNMKKVQYVMILTKADKNVKGKKRNAGKVAPAVLESLRTLLKANKLGSAPMLITSAETKLGRDDVWRYLRLAAEA